MDNRSFITRLAKAIDQDTRETARLAQSLCEVIAGCASETDSTAIPGFGTFVAVKKDETIAVNDETGVRTLLPPHISVTFRPASRLKKSVAKL